MRAGNPSSKPKDPVATAAPRSRRRDAWRATRALALALLLGSQARPAAAAGRDFLDEVLVAPGMEGKEVGFEIKVDSRLDRDYRLQGWFTPELEVGVTRDWMLEAVAGVVNRGRGFELGAWRGETRYTLLHPSRWPFAVAIAGEYEVETRASKRVSLERLVAGRLVVTRVFAGSLLATVNVGVDRRLSPFPNSKPMVAFGVRYPDQAPVTYGFEYRDQPLENQTRFGPSLRIRLPERMKLRIGASFGQKPTQYRFIGRVILETEL